METVRTKWTAWGITCKALGNNKDPCYKKILYKYQDCKQCELKCFYYEKDPSGKKHFHGVMLLQKGFYRKRLCLKGYHLKLEPIYDLDGWLKYCTSDVSKANYLRTKIHARAYDPTADDYADMEEQTSEYYGSHTWHPRKKTTKVVGGNRHAKRLITSDTLCSETNERHDADSEGSYETFMREGYDQFDEKLGHLYLF